MAIVAAQFLKSVYDSTYNAQPAWLTIKRLLVLGLAASALAASKANIIVMVADDLGWSDVGYHGGDIDTPWFDRLAKEGVQLDRFYTTPICSPARAVVMTGRDPIRLGVVYGVIMPWDNTGILT